VSSRAYKPKHAPSAQEPECQAPEGIRSAVGWGRANGETLPD